MRGGCLRLLIDADKQGLGNGEAVLVLSLCGVVMHGTVAVGHVRCWWW